MLNKYKVALGIMFFFSSLQMCCANDFKEPLPKEDMERIKKIYEFDKWEEKVKSPKKEVKKFEFGKDFYNNFTNEEKILTYQNDKYKQSNISLKDKKTNLVNIDVKILFVDTPNEAHQAMLNSMAVSTLPLPVYKKYDPNDPNLGDFRETKDSKLPTIGDICFVPLNLWKPKYSHVPVVKLLRFCRNNIFVEIRINAPEDGTEYPNLIELAAKLDKKLLSISVQKN